MTHPQTAHHLALLAQWEPEPGREPTIEELRRDQRRAPYRGAPLPPNPTP